MIVEGKRHMVEHHRRKDGVVCVGVRRDGHRVEQHRALAYHISRTARAAKSNRMTMAMSVIAPAKATFKSAVVKSNDTIVEATTVGSHHHQPNQSPAAETRKPAAGTIHKAPNTGCHGSPTSTPPASSVVLNAEPVDLGHTQIYDRTEKVNQAVDRQDGAGPSQDDS